jgi:hypothetical protein
MMTFIRRCSTLVTWTSLAFTACGSARSSVIVFSDRLVFRSALAAADSIFNSFVENWDEFSPNTVFPNGTTVRGITYNVSNAAALVVNTGISLSEPNNLYQTAGTSFHPLVDTFTFGFDHPIYAFGITFSSTFAINNGDYLLTTNTGTVVPSFFDPVFPGFSLGQFAGFTSTTPFTSVRVSSVANALYGMDDLVYADLAPEPSTLQILLLGLVGLLFRLASIRQSIDAPRNPRHTSDGP